MADDAEQAERAVYAMVDALKAIGIIHNSTLSLCAVATLVGVMCAGEDDPEAMLAGVIDVARTTIAEMKRA